MSDKDLMTCADKIVAYKAEYEDLTKVKDFLTGDAGTVVDSRLILTARADIHAALESVEFTYKPENFNIILLAYVNSRLHELRHLLALHVNPAYPAVTDVKVNTDESGRSFNHSELPDTEADVFSV